MVFRLRNPPLAQRNIQPPMFTRVGLTDVLVVNLQADGNTGGELAVSVRLLDDNGEIQYSTYNVVYTSGQNKTATFTLNSGYLLGVHVSSSNLVLKQNGELWARVALQRGGGVGPAEMFVLTAGTVTFASTLSWPAHPARDPEESASAYLTVNNVAPGAGIEILFPMVQRVRWRIICALFTLTTSAAVANRSFIVRLRDPNIPREYFRTSSGVVQAASVVNTFSLSPIGVAPVVTNALQLNPNLFHIPWPPDLWLRTPINLETVTANLQAGDVYSNLTMLIEQKIDPWAT